MIDPDSPVLRAAVFGKQVEMFLDSDIGVYLIQCADAQVEESTEKLKRADAEDPKQIRALQFKIQVAESIIHWLRDAINAGSQAQKALEEE